MKTALYYIRTRCNYSQGMVARELDVSRQMLSAWENGTKTIPKARKEELAMLFGFVSEPTEEHSRSIVAERISSRFIFFRSTISFKYTSEKRDFK